MTPELYKRFLTQETAMIEKRNQLVFSELNLTLTMDDPDLEALYSLSHL